MIDQPEGAELDAGVAVEGRRRQARLGEDELQWVEPGDAGGRGGGFGGAGGDGGAGGGKGGAGGVGGGDGGSGGGGIGGGLSLLVEELVGTPAVGRRLDVVRRSICVRTPPWTA